MLGALSPWWLASPQEPPPHVHGGEHEFPLSLLCRSVESAEHRLTSVALGKRAAGIVCQAALESLVSLAGPCALPPPALTAVVETKHKAGLEPREHLPSMHGAGLSPQRVLPQSYILWGKPRTRIAFSPKRFLWLIVLQAVFRL